MTTRRAIFGIGLENDPATDLGTTDQAPNRGKGTKYAGRIGLSLVRSFGDREWSYPKAERAKLWEKG